MDQLAGTNTLVVVAFILVLLNGVMSIWRSFDRGILLFVNILLYVFILIFVLKGQGAEWFGQKYFSSSGPYLTCFTVMASITSLFFLKGAEKINGALFTSIFLILNLSLLFSSNLLKTSLLLVLFEIVEMFVLSNTKDSRKSMLRDVALTKIFSVISLSIATVFIIIAKDSVNLFEFSVQNYELYYLGVCFFVIYFLSVMYITPLEEIKGVSLLNSSNFSVICSILSKFIISGTILISMLKNFILEMEPSAQEGLLSGFKVIIVIAIISLLLRAMNEKNQKKITYYLFCMNNILALLTIYRLDDVSMRPVFSLFSLSSLGLFLGIYIEKNEKSLIKGSSRGVCFILYLLALMALWGPPTTVTFKIKYLFIEGMLNLDTTIIMLLVAFMIVSGLLWYPMVIALSKKIKNKRMDANHESIHNVDIEKQRGNEVILERAEDGGRVQALEIAGLVWISVQIIILNYSNLLTILIYE